MWPTEGSTQQIAPAPSPTAVGTATSSPEAVTPELSPEPATATALSPTLQQATETAVPPTATVTATSTATPTPAAIIRELAQSVPPLRDDFRLAVAFKGLPVAVQATPAHRQEALGAGTVDRFKVLDVVHNTVSEIEAELLAVGDHAYFWFETGPYGIKPVEADLQVTTADFDGIYEQVTAQFGSEALPGIDGDPRLHILHASPQAICGVTADGEGGCGTAGYMGAADLLPASLNPHSNEREMFVMNNLQFGSDFYLGVLAHELRHMIEFNYDEADTDWVKEGSAVLATELVGLPGSGLDRANLFLANPDQQLNSWTEGNTVPYYGQGYLFNQFIYDRLGEAAYRAFATSPLPGLVALDAVAGEFDLDLDGEGLWLDWLAALVLHQDPRVEARYDINLDGLETAAVTALDSGQGLLPADVRQFAADYYELPAAAVTVQFAGNPTVPLLSGQQNVDEPFWVSQRANYSNPRLTRAVDLREVEAATLAYDVYADIELGYDFAYVSVSTDGGTTWIPVTADNMQGLDPADDPSASALAPRFYTGRQQAWVREAVDLTPYAGQEILLRFEMVTDPVLTYSGLAVDNVTVGEIGFRDEGDADGWTAEGFSLTPAHLPQPWHLQLITFVEEGPVVMPVPVSAEGLATFTTDSTSGKQRPILIVAAAAPMTLEPATYTLQVTE